MFSALWDIFSSLVSAFFQVVGALGRGLLDVLSALASAVLWPIVLIFLDLKPKESLSLDSFPDSFLKSEVLL